MRIFLIGFMGSGKTSVASELALRLDCPSYEMDSLVVENSPYSSVAEIFQHEGEKSFRRLEQETFLQLLDVTPPCIISTGGGVGANPELMSQLQLPHSSPESFVIFLSASFFTCKKRVQKDDSRPLFQENDKALKLYTSRQELYKQHAGITIVVDEKTPAEIADEIIFSLKEQI
jgi:shikimate kinase